MILIGQYDSPFVRRVGIALRLYEMPFEHRPWSVFGDADQIRPLNPLTRVPTLVLDDGFVLTDSHMILDYLDSLVAEPLFPREQPARHRALQAAALAMGLAEKAVSLFYERRLHEVTSPVWVARCEGQIGRVLAVLEAARAAQKTHFWLGDRISHVDIAMACAWRFVTEAHAGLIDATAHPALAELAGKMEDMAVFQVISQPFIPPT
jgi:glutathione S-transferase